MMKVVIRKTADVWRRMFARPHEGLNRSRLMGMYLTRTNCTSLFSLEFLQTRQRRNGKFPIDRERG